MPMMHPLEEKDPPDTPYFRLIEVNVINARERQMIIRTNLNVAPELDRLPGVTASSGPTMPWLVLIYITADQPDQMCQQIVQLLADAVAVEKMLGTVDIEWLWIAPRGGEERASE